MQKNFRIDWKQDHTLCVWTGNYKLLQLTEHQLKCTLDDYLLILEGQHIEIEVMYEQQLIVSVERLSHIQIEVSHE
ncbi:MAG: hypothetical protein ABS882_12405 [Lysinibacillus sp.]